MPLAEKDGVQVVFDGHLHAYARSRPHQGVVYAAAGTDARLLDASRRDARGVVVAAMGRGNVPPAMVPGIERWVADGKPVAVVSRAQRGRAGTGPGHAALGGGGARTRVVK